MEKLFKILRNLRKTTKLKIKNYFDFGFLNQSSQPIITTAATAIITMPNCKTFFGNVNMLVGALDITKLVLLVAVRS
jgi:hypothetical protein